jgi:HAMP domain-containing protein
MIGLGSLLGLCLAAAVLLPRTNAPLPPPDATEALTLLAPRPPEPATLGGMGRALAVLDRDLTIWQRLVAPEGRIDLGPLRASMADAASLGREMPEAPPRPGPVEPADDPAGLALTLLAVALAGATLCAGIAALLLERLLFAPFRALRDVADAMAEGNLDSAVPGTGRTDEAGALARSLERLRTAARMAQEEVAPGAGPGIEGATRHIERIAAIAAARALETSLEPGAAREDLAREARELARQVVVIRVAAGQSVAAIARLEAEPTSDVLEAEPTPVVLQTSEAG